MSARYRRERITLLAPILASATLLLSVVTIYSNVSAEEPAYTQTVLVEGVPTHGINGVVFGPDGLLYGSTMMGTGIIRVDVETGRVEKILTDQGSGDDLAFTADGSLAWTALLAQEVRMQSPDGTIKTVATGTPWVNPIKFDDKGNMFIGQVTQPDALQVIDLSGERPPRKIGEGYGGINAFELDGNGGLIAPSTFKGQIIRIDIESGVATVIAEGLGDVVAVRQGPDGFLYGVEWTGGRVIQVDPSSGDFRVIAEPGPPLDNLAIADDGTLYVSRPSDTAIIAVDPKTGDYDFVVKGNFSASGGLVVTERDGETVLFVSDLFGYRFVDPKTGAVTATEFDLFKKAASAVAIDDKIIALAHVQRGAVAVLDRGSEDRISVWSSAQTPMSVALRNGQVIVTDYKAGEVVSFSPGDASTKQILAYGLRGPVGLAVAADDSFIISENTTGRLIGIDNTGRKTIVAEGLNQPEGIALRSDGHIIVAEVGAKQLSVINPQSGEKTVIAQRLPVGDTIGQGVVPVHLPTGVAVTDSGVIYMTGDLDNSILAFTPKQ